MDDALELAMTEIRNDTVDTDVVEAAAQRVWARLSAVRAPEHIRTCADFQALLPEYRARRLSEARAALVQDHLHTCVACRKVYEGRVTVMPAPVAQAPGMRGRQYWAIAAAVVLTAGVAVWFTVGQYGGGNGRALVQSVNGTLFVLASDGILHPLSAGQDLPDGVEIRTAKDSTAMLQLRDGSLVELRERSAVASEAGGNDLTVRLSRGNVIIQAAKRRKGHLYVATADCRVAVTGTVFSVVSGVKGSRVSVVEGEVRVSQENRESVLHPGDQLATSMAIEPAPMRQEIDWSRNREKLIAELGRVQIRLQQVQLPDLRYSSTLLGRLPSDTAVFLSIPNLGDYLGQTQAVFAKELEQSPELRTWWAAKSAHVEPIVAKVRAGSEYLASELVMTAKAGSNGIQSPVFLAETKRDGFPEFLKKTLPGVAVASKPGLVLFGPDAATVETLAASLDSTSAAFQATPFYSRIADAYHQGAGLLFAADLAHTEQASDNGVQYIVAGQKQVDHQMEMRATLGVTGKAGSIAQWLAAPAAMGSLDYVSPEANFVAGFVVRDPAAIVQQVRGAGKLFGASDAPAQLSPVQQQLAATLGGEFAVAFDGPIFPPSWKLVVEVYDPAKALAAIRQIVEGYNQDAVKEGRKPLRTGEETVEGRVYYMVAAADPNPLTEAHYTFADGYLIAGPTRALISKALQTKLAGASITHSAKFVAMQPRDQFTNYSAILFENLGTTLAPLAGLIGSFVPPQARQGANNPLAQLGNIKPMLLAAYAGQDQITFAANGEALPFSSLLSGNLAGMMSGALPMQLGAKKR
jgi:ferric-dicitrate binding protein FerR (iron transport regulator)